MCNKKLLSKEFSDYYNKFHYLHLVKKLRRGVQPKHPNKIMKIGSHTDIYTCKTHEHVCFRFWSVSHGHLSKFAQFNKIENVFGFSYNCSQLTQHKANQLFWKNWQLAFMRNNSRKKQDQMGIVTEISSYLCGVF